jgi:hypothetical protein
VLLIIARLGERRGEADPPVVYLQYRVIGHSTEAWHDYRISDQTRQAPPGTCAGQLKNGGIAEALNRITQEIRRS